jgi:hypothetical protein
MRNNIGNCYYCDTPVMSAPGEANKHIAVSVNGERTVYPTHKACRKTKKGYRQLDSKD